MPFEEDKVDPNGTVLIPEQTPDKKFKSAILLPEETDVCVVQNSK
jgi:hypothetical protein